MKKPQVFIGISGWSYQEGKEKFYPEKLKSKDRLQFYGTVFPTVEINTTFYHAPRLSSVESWYSAVPEDFLFSIKANSEITHLKRLKDCKESLEIFYKNISELKSKTGPILFQLPPSLKMDKERLVEFMKDLQKGYQYTFEFRHKSWFTQEIYELLSKKKIALCISDLNGTLSPEEITADFTYIRLHGPKKAYRGSYSPAQLESWQKKIQKWSSTLSVYCYFDNTMEGDAFQNAKSLQEMTLGEHQLRQ